MSDMLFSTLAGILRFLLTIPGALKYFWGENKKKALDKLRASNGHLKTDHRYVQNISRETVSPDFLLSGKNKGLARWKLFV